MLYQTKRPLKRQNKAIKWSLIAVVAITTLFGLAVAAAYIKPLPKISPPSFEPQAAILSKQPNLTWPSQGQTGIGALGYGNILATHNSDLPVPIASTAKLMTALAVVKQKPLQDSAISHSITISQTDLDFYNQQVNLGGAVIPINFGEELTEYQALQAMIIRSGNNIAYTLANWAFGSIENYQTYAKQLAEELGLTNSTFLDPSGLNGNTTATAKDLLILASAVMQQPALAEIVGQADATIPVAGVIKNTNMLLGQNGIIGIKTGTTPEAGGCLVFAAKKAILGQNITITGVILGQANWPSTSSATINLLNSVGNNFEQVVPIKAGQVVQEYLTPWGSTVSVSAKSDVSLLRWVGDETIQEPNIDTFSISQPVGSKVGELIVQAGDQLAKTDLVINQPISSPSFWWRLKRLFS